MRKIKKKGDKNVNLNKINLNKINKILIALIFAVYIFIGICIHVNKPQYGETFINLDYDLNDLKNNVISTLKKYNQPVEPVKEEEEIPVYEEDTGVEDESYIIEQERLKHNRMDKYMIKGQTGNLKFVTKGEWDIDKIQFKIMSVHGGHLDVHKTDSTIYNFELEDFKVKFTYKRSTILGKISINNKEHFYLKKYKRSLNFYDEYNNRVSHGTYFKSQPKDENMIHFYKLIFDATYSKYKQIFLTIYLLYLQILKNENYSDIQVVDTD